MQYRKNLKTLVVVTTALVYCSAADAQFGDLLKTLEKAAKQAEQAQPTSQNPKPVQSSSKSVAAPAYMSKADWNDLYEHAENPSYLRKFEGRPALISGEISVFEKKYTIHEGDDYTGTIYDCKSVVGNLPSSGMVKVEAQLAAPYVEAGEDGSAIFLKNCRIANGSR
jgi:hypothetical protein